MTKLRSGWIIAFTIIVIKFELNKETINYTILRDDQINVII